MATGIFKTCQHTSIPKTINSNVCRLGVDEQTGATTAGELIGLQIKIHKFILHEYNINIT